MKRVKWKNLENFTQEYNTAIQYKGMFLDGKQNLWKWMDFSK
jgi:hypothetical protein